MNILNKIAAYKYQEIALKKQIVPLKQLEKAVLFSRKTVSLSQKLQSQKFGIIAEHKRRSPSKTVINQSLKVTEVVKGYECGGACGISILTDNSFFGGSLEDLLIARASSDIPLLRKDFIVDSYQIIEAKAFGADVILLIAAILTKEQIKNLVQLANQLELEVLLEVHNEEDLEKSLLPDIAMLGVNNRNLKSFEVSVDISKSLSNKIPDNFVKVSESGINNRNTIEELITYGYKGFLMGEHFMKTSNPGETLQYFTEALTTHS